MIIKISDVQLVCAENMAKRRNAISEDCPQNGGVWTAEYILQSSVNIGLAKAESLIKNLEMLMATEFTGKPN